MATNIILNIRQQKHCHQFYKLDISDQATTKPLDDIAWYITSKAPFNTEYGIVEFFDFTEYVMSSLSIIGELLSVARVPEMGSSLGGRRTMVRRMNFRPDITFNFSTLVNLATPKKMCGFGPSFL